MRAAVWFIACTAVLGACGSRAPVDAGGADGGGDQWVCQPADEGWQCDQGEEPPAPSPQEQDP